MTTEQGKPDVPRMVATIIWTVPGFLIGTGVAYLRMRKDLQKSARTFYMGMIEAGMPPEQAQRLREKYENDLSTHGLIKSLGVSLPGVSSTPPGK